jgi:recombination protein RecR
MKNNDSPAIQKLIELFSQFPTIGPRTAGRFVFHLLKAPKQEIDNLVAAIINLRSRVRLCEFCFNPFEPSPDKGQENKLCEICSNPLRQKSLLCITASETDLNSIEKTKKYKGIYFILGGTVSALKKTDLEKLRINELESRIKNRPEIQEIILAMSATTEGEATGLYLERFLKPFNKKITRLGRGLPVGGELEYADEETISSALEARK